jgi:hypothetical protein
MVDLKGLLLVLTQKGGNGEGNAVGLLLLVVLVVVVMCWRYLSQEGALTGS